MTLKKAKDYFYQKDYQSALNLFIKENEYYSCGLCCLLLDDTKGAFDFWNKKRNTCPACIWGLSILDIIEGKIIKYPSFFQTRAFLEVYLNLLIENDKIDWAQNIINCCDEFYKCNPESYKFIARALFSHGYLNMAIKFCKKSLKIFYSDPEALLILSQCLFLLNDLGESLDSINRLLNIADDYYPAIIFRKIIKDEIEARRKS